MPRPERPARRAASRVMVTVRTQPSTSSGLPATIGHAVELRHGRRGDGVDVGQFTVGLRQAHEHVVARHRRAAGAEREERLDRALRPAHRDRPGLLPCAEDHRPARRCGERLVELELVERDETLGVDAVHADAQEQLPAGLPDALGQVVVSRDRRLGLVGDAVLLDELADGRDEASRGRSRFSVADLSGRRRGGRSPGSRACPAPPLRLANRSARATASAAVSPWPSAPISRGPLRGRSDAPPTITKKSLPPARGDQMLEHFPLLRHGRRHEGAHGDHLGARVARRP